MTPPRPKRLTSAQADALINSVRLAKAGSWAATRDWEVVADTGTVLVVVTPSYGGTSRSGRNGWTYYLPGIGPARAGEQWPTRETAMLQGLGAWKRHATAPR
jgi:hypothetical protein